VNRATAAEGGASISAALAGAGWHALAALVLGVFMGAAVVCWAIADPGRARRLTALIRAWREPTARPAACAVSAPAKQRPPPAPPNG
jgi:hypothetical protein